MTRWQEGHFLLVAKSKQLDGLSASFKGIVSPSCETELLSVCCAARAKQALAEADMESGGAQAKSEGHPSSSGGGAKSCRSHHSSEAGHAGITDHAVSSSHTCHSYQSHTYPQLRREVLFWHSRAFYTKNV